MRYREPISEDAKRAAEGFRARAASRHLKGDDLTEALARAMDEFGTQRAVAARQEARTEMREQWLKALSDYFSVTRIESFFEKEGPR